MFILGWKDSLKLIEKLKMNDFEVVWVDDKNEVHMTKGLDGVVQIVKQPTPGT